MKCHPNGTPVKPPRPAKTLGPAGRALWNKLQLAYAITDEGGLTSLETVCKAEDDLARLREHVRKQGDYVYDRFRQLKVNPLLASIRGVETTKRQALRALNLDIAPTKEGR